MPTQKVSIPLATNLRYYTTAGGNLSQPETYMQNCVVMEEDNRVVVVKRPYLEMARTTTRYIYGMHNWHQYNFAQLITVEGSGSAPTVYRGTTGSGTSIGALTNTPEVDFDRACFCESQDGYLVVHARTVGNENCYYINTSYTMTRLTNATHGFPTGTPLANGIVSMDGYVFVLQTDGKIYNSNVSDVTTWTSTDFITAERFQDVGQFICKHNNNIVYLGTSSIEFFYNAGNPSGSPLARRDDVFYDIGVANWDSYYANQRVDANDSLIAFIGSKRPEPSFGDETIGVYIISNFQLKKISTSDIDQIISGSDTLRILELLDRTVILVSTHSGNVTYAYDTKTNLWFLWTYGDAVNDVSDADLDLRDTHSRWLAVRVDSPLGNQIHHTQDYSGGGDGSSGYVYQGFTAEILTQDGDGGTYQKKFCSSMSLVGEHCDDSSAQNITVSWSDDSGKNFETSRTIDMRYLRPEFRLGAFNRRKFKVSYLGTKPVRWERLDLMVDVTEYMKADQ